MQISMPSGKSCLASHSVIRLATALLLSVGAGILAARSAQPAPKPADDPATLTDALREATPDDFLRVTYVGPGTNVTSLARPGAIRAFATATAFYRPPLPLKEFPSYSGLVNDDGKTLVALRCRPPRPEAVDAILATWPNLFRAIERDVPRDPKDCPAPASTATTNASVEGATVVMTTATGVFTDPALQAFCFAHAYRDLPGSIVPRTLAAALDYAAQAFDPADPQRVQLANWLRNQYGVFPAFSGLGFSVKDSYSLDSQPMSAQQVLAKSVSPEYVLKNVSLKEAGCRCIAVPPYPGRADDKLDPEWIAKAGGDGSCNPVPSLKPEHKAVTFPK